MTTKIIAGWVTYAKIQNIAAARLLGNATAALAVASEIMVSTGLNLSTNGALTATGAGSITTITTAYTATTADYTILCNAGAGGFY
ncbi:hypothetical protein ACM55I_13850 [Flavobacterium sp. GB2R13]|uniref:hypothetical protein n=1 Tax=Flavobacterium algoris TaxID=3398733 RepID=UPI003A883C30